MGKVLLQMLFICAVLVVFVASDPLSLAVGFMARLTVFDFVKCPFTECCNNKWIIENTTGLEYDLKTLLHGQHLVADTVLRSIRGHLTNSQPQKALVLSLHGCTGCGKNYVSQIIAKNLYYKGMESSFVHLSIATHHFPHADKTETYKEDLRVKIREHVSKCERSLFVFDEMDKMPAGVIDVIKPYIDHYEGVDGVDYRKSIFIFLSNNGGDVITRRTLKHWERGEDRENLQLMDMEEILTIGTFNEKGGLWHSSLIEKHLISAFIPFLPMERKHVKMCIADDLRNKNRTVSDDLVNKIADQIHYYPADNPVFAKSGCKPVSDKVNLIVDDGR